MRLSLALPDFRLAANRGRADDDLSMTAGTNRLCALAGASQITAVATSMPSGPDTELPLVAISATIRALSSSLNDRRRPVPVKTSSRCTGLVIAIQWHARLPQDPARCCGTGRPRRLLDQARAGFRRGISEIAAGRSQVARHRCLSGVRHRRPRHDRLRDAGARGHGRQRGPDHGDHTARHRRSRGTRRRRRDRRYLTRSASSLDPPRARRSHRSADGTSPCGRTNMRIKGWMGRADQTTKVKGMFVRPEQIAEIGKRHPELGGYASSSHATARPM